MLRTLLTLFALVTIASSGKSTKKMCKRATKSFDAKCIKKGFVSAVLEGCDVNDKTNTLVKKTERTCKTLEKKVEKCGFTCEKPVDGGFGDWSAWEECSAECDGGTQSRSRACDSPAPAAGGKDCSGALSEEQQCNEEPCLKPIDGALSDWSAWGQCSAECDGGTQSRSRSCDSPAPADGGKDCSGDLEEEQNCNEEACPSPITITKGDVNLAQLPLAPQVWPGPDHKLHLTTNLFGTLINLGPDKWFTVGVIFNSPTMGTTKLELKRYMPESDPSGIVYIGYSSDDLDGNERTGMACTHSYSEFPSEIMASPHSKEAWLSVDGVDETGCADWLDFLVDRFMPTVTTWTIDNTGDSWMMSSEELANVLDISYEIIR